MVSKRLLTLFWGILALTALLAMGALQQRQEFITRGLPTTLPEPIPHAGAHLGINVALEQYNDAALTDTLAAIEQTGIRYLKQTFYFSESYDWAATDRLLTAVSNQNLTLIPLLDGNPSNNFAPIPPSQFATWAANFANRYGDQIDYYIIWDEPNLTTHWGLQPVNPDQYAALLTATATAIRATDATATLVAAPLAPTVETGPQNLSEPLFLQSLYESGAKDAFDIVANKPYGFDFSPTDRTLTSNSLNFNRSILLREVMQRYGDAHKAIWAGNWGWNSLPPTWQGDPSVWGQTTAAQQGDYIVAALTRAQIEWPWHGILFLENWEPNVAANDARWGFSIANRPAATAVTTYLNQQTDTIAQPGFHLATATHPAQQFQGEWEFSPQFGADIGQTGDQVTFTFWGTDVGLRVRRANFRARLHVTVDGQPANALPQDEHGSTLILTAANPDDNFITIEPIAQNLAPGVHTVTIKAARGWDQWALNGFSVAYTPPSTTYRLTRLLLALTALLSLFAVQHNARQAQWGTVGSKIRAQYHQLHHYTQITITAVAAFLVSITASLTWASTTAGIYRRLGDNAQIALTAATATIFYVTPTFILFMFALLILFCLIYWRPAWGLLLIAFTIPFYVPPLPKPILNFRFSAVEVFTLLTLTAVLLIFLHQRLKQRAQSTLSKQTYQRHSADYAVLAFTIVATLSLLFTERLDVATNEWRVVIIEPALFYVALRLTNLKEKELWYILDAFIVGGLIVALYGLWQYGTGQNLITAEGGLMRLRSIYGSPNNAALYLGRILPLLAAATLLGQQMPQRRRWAYTAAAIPITVAILLTFSKGALFLGLPAAALFIFWRWQTAAGRRTWPWVIVASTAGVGALFVAQQIPQLAGRLDLGGATGVFRLNLWGASLNMVREHPIFGVGLDNFLYAYRSRYIFDAAWQEPNLNHPHNIILDFATRLGLLGLLTGGWMIAQLGHLLRHLSQQLSPPNIPLVIGLSASLIDMLVHGLVDHSFFLIDLAFAFYLMLATAVWLSQNQKNNFRNQST